MTVFKATTVTIAPLFYVPLNVFMTDSLRSDGPESPDPLFVMDSLFLSYLFSQVDGLTDNSWLRRGAGTGDGGGEGRVLDVKGRKEW